MTAGQFILKLGEKSKAKRDGDGWLACCPGHEDKTPSLSVKDADNGGTVIKCFAGCSAAQVCQSVGLGLADLMPDDEARPFSRSKVVATYHYHDEDGVVLYRVLRDERKKFWQQRPDGNGGWTKIGSTRRVLFRLHEIIMAVAANKTIFIAEGEKDVQALVGAGHEATCNSGGADNGSGTKWFPEFAEVFKGASVVIIADKDEPGRKHAQHVARTLKGKAASIKVIELPDVEGRTVKDPHDYFTAGATAEDFAAVIGSAPEWTAAEDPESKRIRELLISRRFNPDQKPKDAHPVYWIGDVGICTPGNLTAISSDVKTGKSAVIAAAMSSTIADASRDTLGLRSENPKRLALLHYDTEQSEFDHWSHNDRVLRRAGVSGKPDWLHSYYLTGVPVRDLVAAIKQDMADKASAHGGIHSVLIDGGADLASDVNDPEESNGLVAQLHGLAIQYHCSIIAVIHLNPGSEKTRGHFGSQLERKAETNLVLERDGEVTVIYAKKQRRAPILKEHGPRFRWSNDAMMHMTCSADESPSNVAKVEALRLLRDEVFSGRPSMRYGEWIATAKNALRCSERTAETKFSECRKYGLLSKSVANLWTPSN